MSIGNLKDQGNKGNNFSYQLKNLQLLSAINENSLGLATEATLLAVYQALQDGQSFIQTLVSDLGGIGCPTVCPTYLEIKIYDSITHTFDPPIYYDANGTVVIPVGPLQYINPEYVLQNILNQVTAINADLDVNLSTRNAEATQLLIKALLTSIDADTSNIAADTTATRTAKVISTTGSGTIPGNPLTVSIFNANTMSGSVTIDGTTISVPGGVTLSYDAGGLNNKFATGNFVYNATGTTFIITYVI